MCQAQGTAGCAVFALAMVDLDIVQASTRSGMRGAIAAARLFHWLLRAEAE